MPKPEGKCKADGCSKDAAVGRVYCKREHSPYGMAFDLHENYHESNKRLKKLEEEYAIYDNNGIIYKDCVGKIKRKKR